MLDENQGNLHIITLGHLVSEKVKSIPKSILISISI